jgi:hypothetical protein
VKRGELECFLYTIDAILLDTLAGQESDFSKDS